MSKLSDAASVKVGSLAASKVYLGTNQVWVQASASPVLTDQFETAWDTTATPKTLAHATAVGSAIFALCASGDTDSGPLSPPSSSGPVWISKVSTAVTQHCPLYCYSAVALDPQSTDFARTGGTAEFGGAVIAFASGASSGASAAGIDSQTITLSTTVANSGLLVMIGDWDAGDWGTTRSWITVGSAPTELLYHRIATRYTIGVAWYPDVGAAGSKTVGLTGLTGTWTALAIEVMG